MTNDDILAAERILSPWNGVKIKDAIIEQPRSYDRTYHTYQVPSSSLVRGYFTVEERSDTVVGGKYLFCNCPGWKYQRGKGKDCRHVATVREIQDVR